MFTRGWKSLQRPSKEYNRFSFNGLCLISERTKTDELPYFAGGKTLLIFLAVKYRQNLSPPAVQTIGIGKRGLLK
jgi:hypothetical protein